MRTPPFVVVLLAAGCSSAPPAPPVAPPPPTGAGMLSGDRLYEPPRPAATRTHGGKTAEKWADGLRSPDPASRQQAARALRDLDEAGYPHLLRGIKEGPTEVRLASLHALYKPVFVAHKQDMLPLLVPLLRDPHPRLREAAAVRLAWCGTDARPHLPALRVLSAADPDTAVRTAASDSIEILEGGE